MRFGDGIFSCKAKKYDKAESIMTQLERLERGDLSGRHGDAEEGSEDRPAGGDGSSQQSVSLIRSLHTNADVVACQVSSPTPPLAAPPRRCGQLRDGL